MIELVLADHKTVTASEVRCFGCACVMTRTVESCRYTYGDLVFLIHNVEVYKCPDCGVSTYSSEVAKMIENAIMGEVYGV